MYENFFKFLSLIEPESSTRIINIPVLPYVDAIELSKLLNMKLLPSNIKCSIDVDDRTLLVRPQYIKEPILH